MVILANRHRSYNGDTRTPSISSERETYSVNTPLATKLDEGSFLPNHLRGEMSPDTRRHLYLSLTLTNWTPLPPQGLWLQHTTVGRNGLLTPNSSGSRTRLITSASPAASSPFRPLTASDTQIRSNTLAGRQHATDRFPRFAYLLRHGTPLPENQTDDRHGGTVQPESQLDNRCSRRSADPHSASGRAHASLATNPDGRTQCGGCHETALQSCAAASASGTLSPSSPSTPPSPSRATASASATSPVLSEFPASEFSSKDQQRSDSLFCAVTMASYQSASSSSRGGSRTEQLLAHTRKGANCIASERITGETQLSYASAQNQPHSPVSTQHEEVDEDEQDQQDSQGGAQTQTTADGQPKKKKTRRAGVAITRVRRMQREVRRLAEEVEEASAQRQPQPSLLLGAQIPPASPISPTATSPTTRQFQGLPFTGAANSPPRAFTSPVGSLARTSTERQPRSEALQAGLTAHSRGPAYDRILEDGDDVVLLRLPGVGRAPPGSSIWTYRPDERPRGGSA